MGGVDATRFYRESFRPSPRLAAPQASVAVFALCAETEADAERLARCRDLFTRLRSYELLAEAFGLE